MSIKDIREITVYNGKYTFRFNEKTGGFECYRYGEPWRNLSGDGAILALFQEIERLRKKYEERCWCSAEMPNVCGHKENL
jgi:hypothetical protein